MRRVEKASVVVNAASVRSGTLRKRRKGVKKTVRVDGIVSVGCGDIAKGREAIEVSTKKVPL